MSQRVTVSVAMCTYNGAKFVREQLNSIAAQTWPPNEIVICDDRSTDETVEIIRQFAAESAFPVHLHVNEHNLGHAAKGITHNFEKAVSLCSGDLIMPCDQDDVWMPEKVERMAAVFLADPQVGAVFCDAQLVTETGEPKGVLLSHANGFSQREQQQLARGNGLPTALSPTKAYGCTLMFRAALREKILPVPPHWWFDAWVTCVSIVYTRFVFVPERLMHYRIHAEQFGGAAVPTLSERVGHWHSSAEKYWASAGPQLADLHDRLEAEHDLRFQPTLNYLEGRSGLLRYRAQLQGNWIVRRARILLHTRQYFLYFNGWRSLVKDLTAS